MTRTAAALLLLITTTAGCHHAGTVPPGWHATPLASPPPHAQGNGEHSSAQLQVFICYGNQLSNHTALRLTAPHKPTLMWDPGGTFLQHDPTRARRHDVITQNAPTVNEWWRYRRDGCREPIMEVFQWSLNPDQANRLHAILTDWQDPNDPTQTFEPDAGGLQCCKKVSEFLMRFADRRPHVTEKMFWPHKLGEHLWTQHPDRVLIFHADGETHQYQRDPASPVVE